MSYDDSLVCVCIYLYSFVNMFRVRVLETCGYGCDRVSGSVPPLILSKSHVGLEIA